MSKDISQLSVKALLSGSMSYLIPIYQRNYAWGSSEIAQLIQDVIDNVKEKQVAYKSYYIGTLVVYETSERANNVYETIDGQQRLTTLSLLVSYLKNSNPADFSWYKKLNIEFECRNKSHYTFTEIFEGKDEQLVSNSENNENINHAILDGYRLIKENLKSLLRNSKVKMSDFSDYLLNHVQVMRVKVPEDTNLNHYFEIMNSRGEQLEKHEVLKSRLMSVLEEEIATEQIKVESIDCLHTVWEACANMEKYVQMGFTPEQRQSIFGNNWGKFEVNDFKSLREAISTVEKGKGTNKVTQKLTEILASDRTSSPKDRQNFEPTERFHSVINFPNFLLHALRVVTGKNVVLDDKKLLDEFDTYVFKHENPRRMVQDFIFGLLKCKFIFDQYIIKREFKNGDDKWSLSSLKYYPDRRNASYVNSFGKTDADEGNRSILMLLAAFHVSTPTMIYKHWLSAVLNYLFYADVKEKPYLSYLEAVAKAFMFDRFVRADGLDYYDIIFENNGECQSEVSEIDIDELMFKLSYGNIENNFVFNYLDYLLWKKYRFKFEKIGSYEFTFRSSVEHWYPQNPIGNNKKMAPDSLNSFGNLCLISHSKNSKLSNYMPIAKQDHYLKNTIDSPKQFLMTELMKGKSTDAWNEKTIERHFNDMKSVLLEVF